MTPPISKSPPAGTRLEAIVNALEALRTQEDWAKSEDPRIREMGAQAKLEEEPRVWMLPHELVRDHVVLPQIAEMIGRAAAERVKEEFPCIFDRLAEDARELAKRRATARERLAPRPDVSSLVVMAVMGVFIGRWEAGRSPTSQYIRTANHLGVDRGFIRRVHGKVLRNMARFKGEDLTKLAMAYADGADLVCSLPEMKSGPSRGRRNLSVSRMRVSSGVEQGASRSSEN